MQRRLLDAVAEQTHAVAESYGEGKTLTAGAHIVELELAKDGVEKYIDAQKKLLNLAIHQMEANGKAAAEAYEEPCKSFAELTQKSVHNLVAAQKSLMDLAVKPARTPATERKAKATHRARPKHR